MGSANTDSQQENKKINMKTYFIASVLVVVVNSFPDHSVQNGYQSIQFDLNNDSESWSGHRRQPLPEPIGGNGRHTRPWNGRQGDKRSNNGRHTRPWNGNQEDTRGNTRGKRDITSGHSNYQTIHYELNHETKQPLPERVGGHRRHTSPWNGEQEDSRPNNGRHTRPWNGEQVGFRAYTREKREAFSYNGRQSNTRQGDTRPYSGRQGDTRPYSGRLGDTRPYNGRQGDTRPYSGRQG